jgi:hypothetical protein
MSWSNIRISNSRREQLSTNNIDLLNAVIEQGEENSSVVIDNDSMIIFQQNLDVAPDFMTADGRYVYENGGFEIDEISYTFEYEENLRRRLMSVYCNTDEDNNSNCSMPDLVDIDSDSDIELDVNDVEEQE